MTSIAQGRLPLSASPASWIVRLFGDMRRTQLERQTYEQLSRLSDRELDDLGITRGNLREVAREAATNA